MNIEEKLLGKEYPIKDMDGAVAFARKITEVLVLENVAGLVIGLDGRKLKKVSAKILADFNVKNYNRLFKGLYGQWYFLKENIIKENVISINPEDWVYYVNITANTEHKLHIGGNIANSANGFSNILNNQDREELYTKLLELDREYENQYNLSRENAKMSLIDKILNAS